MSAAEFRIPIRPYVLSSLQSELKWILYKNYVAPPKNKYSINVKKNCAQNYRYDFKLNFERQVWVITIIITIPYKLKDGILQS